MESFLMQQCKPIYLIILLCISFSLYAALPKDERVPGGVAVIKLPKKYDRQIKPPQVVFENEKIALMRVKDEGQLAWYAVVGLPLTMEPGNRYLTLLNGRDSQRLDFQIRHKNYPEEKLFFKQKSHVKPNLELLARIERETEHLNRVFSHWTDKELPDVTLRQPVKGRISSEYGKKRLMNNEVKSRHKGIDIAAPTGTPVKVARSGIVVDVGNYFYTGNTVIVDHGQGFKTIYCHLNTLSVKLGEVVGDNQKIGTVGQTGRATGSHLHFGVSLNNTRVSPDLFFVYNDVKGS